MTLLKTLKKNTKILKKIKNIQECKTDPKTVCVFVWFCFLGFLSFWRLVFSVFLWLSWSSLCRPGWPRTQKSTTSASQVLWLKARATISYRKIHVPTSKLLHKIKASKMSSCSASPCHFDWLTAANLWVLEETIHLKVQFGSLEASKRRVPSSLDVASNSGQWLPITNSV